MLVLFKKFLILVCFVWVSYSCATESFKEQLSKAQDPTKVVKLVKKKKDLSQEDKNHVKIRLSEWLDWATHSQQCFGENLTEKLLSDLINCGIDNEKERNKMLFLIDQLSSEKPTIQIDDADAKQEIIRWLNYYNNNSTAPTLSVNFYNKIAKLMEKYTFDSISNEKEKVVFKNKSYTPQELIQKLQNSEFLIQNCFNLFELSELIENNQNFITSQKILIQNHIIDWLEWRTHFGMKCDIDTTKEELVDIIKKCGINNEKEYNKMLFLYDQLFFNNEPTIQIDDEDAKQEIINWAQYFEKRNKPILNQDLQDLISKIRELANKYGISEQVKNILEKAKKRGLAVNKATSSSFFDPLFCHWKPILITVSAVTIGLIGVWALKKIYPQYFNHMGKRLCSFFTIPSFFKRRVSHKPSLYVPLV